MKTYKLLLLALFISATAGHAQHWKALPFSFDKSAVTCIPDPESDSMYIIGNFYHVNGNAAEIVKWDGDTNVTYINIFNTCGGCIDDVTSYQSKMFVAAAGILLRRDDTGWYWTNNPNWDQAYKFFRLGNRVAVAMEHYEPGFSTPSIHLTVWDGTVWKDTLRYDTVDTEHIMFTSSIASYKGQLYAAGNIHPSTKPLINGIVRFDGTTWWDVGGGINTGGAGYIAKLLVWRGDLYACGSFFESEGAPGNDIARWDGVSWHRLGAGLTSGYGNGAVDIAVYNDELYVVGNFSQAGGLTSDGLAKWDGRKWCVVNDDFGTAAPAQIFEFKGDMYVSGRWFTINGAPFNHIAKWAGGAFGDTCSVPLSVNSPTPSASVIIYPNPASDVVFIGLTDVEAVSIYDMQGRLVSKASNYVPGKGVDVSKFATGLYMLRIESSRGAITRRFVKD